MATCTTCASSVSDTDAYSWTYEKARGTAYRICVSCSRGQLDAIEARFEPDWAS
ncbi:hypothetical protein [Mumia sp. DW29H23]|uniref:hypothetical protein n=1 Tax=Mumia sp. DW29H23 TaxID=3421241 RepID=UPI003D697FD9